MAQLGDWQLEESRDIYNLVANVYRSANIYISDKTEEQLSHWLDRLCRCSKCHTLLDKQDALSPTTPRFIIREGGTILKRICSQCLEDILNNNQRMLTCEGCGRQFHYLFTHHWYDPNNYAKVCSREICQFCNAQLRSSSLWKPHKHTEWRNHILPNWNLQLLYLKDRVGYQTRRDEEYPWPIKRPHSPKY